MAECEDCDIFSIFMDDFVKEVELNPDFKVDSSSDSETNEESPTPLSCNTFGSQCRLPSTAEGIKSI